MNQINDTDLIIEGLGLKDAKAVVCPGEEEREWEKEEGETPLAGRRQTEFRAIAARANYLALDRSDIQYAVKEMCRGMAVPKERDWKKLKILGRYLVGAPRVVSKYE